jgi:hypothetical protein
MERTPNIAICLQSWNVPAGVGSSPEGEDPEEGPVGSSRPAEHRNYCPNQNKFHRVVLDARRG